MEKEWKRPDYFPPLQPEIRLVLPQTRNEIFCSDRALAELASLFPEDSSTRTIIYETVEIVRPQLEKRWQLGYFPYVFFPDFQAPPKVKFPQIKEYEQNNRFRHSLEVAKTAVEIGKKIGLDERVLICLAVGGLIHDFCHPVFSHVGDELFDTINKRVKVKKNEALLHFFQTKNLVGSHRERLTNLLQNPDSQLGNFVRENLGDAEKLGQAVNEKGLLGQILEIADVCGYLNLDTVQLGYKPPHFERHIEGALAVYRGELAVKDSYGEKCLRHLLSFRDFMYRHHYVSPVTLLFEKMQVAALQEYLLSLDPRAEAMKMAEFLGQPDGEILKLMRRRTVLWQSFNGLSFFGIPYPQFVLAPLPNERDLVNPDPRRLADYEDWTRLKNDWGYVLDDRHIHVDPVSFQKTIRVFSYKEGKRKVLTAESKSEQCTTDHWWREGKHSYLFYHLPAEFGRHGYTLSPRERELYLIADFFYQLAPVFPTVKKEIWNQAIRFFYHRFLEKNQGWELGEQDGKQIVAEIFKLVSDDFSAEHSF